MYVSIQAFIRKLGTKFAFSEVRNRKLSFANLSDVHYW